jgi:hypothetical protein
VTFCMAVGAEAHGVYGYHSPYGELWDGRTWTNEPIVGPSKQDVALTGRLVHLQNCLCGCRRSLPPPPATPRRLRATLERPPLADHPLPNRRPVRSLVGSLVHVRDCVHGRGSARRPRCSVVEWS